MYEKTYERRVALYIYIYIYIYVWTRGCTERFIS